MFRIESYKDTSSHFFHGIFVFCQELKFDDLSLDLHRQNALALVVQTMDSASRRINHYPVDKSRRNQLRE